MRQLLDWVTTVTQYTLVTIDISDGAIAAGGRNEAWVEGEHPRMAVQLRDIDGIRSFGAGEDIQLNRFARVVERKCGFAVRHVAVPRTRRYPEIGQA